MVRNKPECGSGVSRKTSPRAPTPSVTVPPAVVPPANITPDRVNPNPGKVKGRPVHHQHGICVWHLDGSLRLVSKTTHSPYKCSDPSSLVHKPLSEVKQSDAVELLEDKDFLKSCGSTELQKAIKDAVRTQASKFSK